MMKPGGKIKLKTMKVFLSDYNFNVEKTIKRFTELQDRFIKAAEQAAKHDLSKVKIASP